MIKMISGSGMSSGKQKAQPPAVSKPSGHGGSNNFLGGQITDSPPSALPPLLYSEAEQLIEGEKLRNIVQNASPSNMDELVSQISYETSSNAPVSSLVNVG